MGTLRSAIEYEVLRIRMKALSKNILYMEISNKNSIWFSMSMVWYWATMFKIRSRKRTVHSLLSEEV